MNLKLFYSQSAVENVLRKHSIHIVHTHTHYTRYTRQAHMDHGNARLPGHGSLQQLQVGIRGELQNVLKQKETQRVPVN